MTERRNENDGGLGRHSNPSQRLFERGVPSSVAVLSSVCFLALLVWWFWRVREGYRPLFLPYDDAYMFYRYAVHMSAGNGIAWDPGGAHTYGVTSPLWLVVIWIGTLLTKNMLYLVMSASVLSSVLAFFVMAWAVWTNARSNLLRHRPTALLTVMVLMFPLTTFVASARNGMETSFSFAVIALLLGLNMRWIQGRTGPAWVGVVGILALLTRPESALGTILMLFVSFFLLESDRRKEPLVAAAVLVAGIAAQLAICKLYFGSALPLSFYIKAHHSYLGYLRSWHPVTNAVLDLKGCALPIGILLLLSRWRQRGLIALYLIPAATTFLYMTTTLQIMGGDGRYYVPYSAYLVFAAALVIDDWITAKDEASFSWKDWTWVARVCILLLLLVATRQLKGNHLLEKLDARSEGPLVFYDRPEFQIASSTPLPEVNEMQARFAVPDYLVRNLPDGATVASSEVGYLGAVQPKVNVIDLVGLNDTQIALHGFHMDYLLSKHPDVIWMVHPDYSHQYGVMLSDPRLLEMYDVYPGAGSYGLALLKNSPYRASIDHNMQAFWKSQYHDLPMEQYRALSIRWDGQFHTSARADQE